MLCRCIWCCAQPPHHFRKHTCNSPNFCPNILSNFISPIFVKCLFITLFTLKNIKTINIIISFIINKADDKLHGVKLGFNRTRAGARLLRYVPWIRKDDFLACSGGWSWFRLLHRHEIADISQHSLQVGHFYKNIDHKTMRSIPKIDFTPSV